MGTDECGISLFGFCLCIFVVVVVYANISSVLSIVPGISILTMQRAQNVWPGIAGIVIFSLSRLPTWRVLLTFPSLQRRWKNRELSHSRKRWYAFWLVIYSRRSMVKADRFKSIMWILFVGLLWLLPDRLVASGLAFTVIGLPRRRVTEGNFQSKQGRLQHFLVLHAHRNLRAPYLSTPLRTRFFFKLIHNRGIGNCCKFRKPHMLNFSWKFLPPDRNLFRSGYQQKLLPTSREYNTNVVSPQTNSLFLFFYPPC